MKAYETAAIMIMIALVFATTFFLLGKMVEHKETTTAWALDDFDIYERDNCTISYSNNFTYSLAWANTTARTSTFYKSCAILVISERKVEEALGK